MTTPDWESIPANFENLRDKWDILEPERFPKDGPCDMNYRIHQGHAVAMTVFFLCAFAAVTIVAATFFRSFNSFFWSPMTLATCFLVGCIVAFVRLARDLSTVSARILFWLAAPPISWLVLSAFPITGTLLGAWQFLAIIAVPVAIFFADQFTLHAVHWMTACPRVDISTMFAWRRHWQKRWLGYPDHNPHGRNLSPADQQLHRRVLAACQAYRRGVVYVFLLVVALPFVWYQSHRHQPSHVVGASTCFIMLLAPIVAALTRTISNPKALRVFMQCAWHWLGHTGGEEGPPWVLRSPVGPNNYRWIKTILCLIILCAPLLPIADHCFWFVGGAAPRTAADGPVLYAALEFNGPFPFLCLACQWICNAALPILVLGSVTFLMTCPVLEGHFAALEAPDAYEAHPDWSVFDGYVHRLQFSRNPHERNALLVGFHPLFHYPLLLDRGLLFEHRHVLGPTGTGKSAIGITTQMIQLIRCGDGPVFIFDLKGDDALLHTAHIEAQRAGLDFKWFTNLPNRSTFVFNPLDLDLQQTLTLSEVVGFLTQALNLFHGTDYGRAFFSMMSRYIVRTSFLSTSQHPDHLRTRNRTAPENPPIESFRDLSRIVMQEMKGEDRKAAEHVACLLETLTDFEQLNLAPNRNPHHTALANAISMPEAIRKRQVIYFYLVGATDIASVGEIARLALFRLLTACIAHKHRHGRAPKAYCIIDEAQAIIASNIANVLAQARSHGLSVTLCHQTMSQLAPPGGPDMREIVMGCTSAKEIYAARDPWLQDYLSKVSGQTKYKDVSYTWQPTHGWCPSVRYRTGPRLTPQDIADINRDENMCVMTIERGKGLSRTHGFFPMSVDWPLEEREYQRRLNDIPWMAQSDATLSVPAFWPEANEQTIIASTHPGQAPSLDAEQRLNQLRADLDQSTT